MDSSCQNSDLNIKSLLGQLNVARKEINNLRQQIKSLRYVHEKDIDSIRRLLETCGTEMPMSNTKAISSQDAKPSTSTDDGSIKFKPIGVISTWFSSKRGTPRQTGVCAKVPGKLVLFNSVFTNPDHALEGLQDFSHMWILFYFHRNDSTHIRAKVAPPRLNGTRTGVFSTRSPHRPCPIGLSLVKVTRIENRTIFFEGVDMVDQSPVLDVKPYIPQYDSPLYFEKLTKRLHEGDIDASDDPFDRVGETAAFSTDETFGVFSTDVQVVNEIRSLLSDDYPRKSVHDAGGDAYISRDEEIALRLQAEEFQGNSNFESYNSTRHFSQLTDTINLENNEALLRNVDATSMTHRASQIFPNISSDTRSDVSIPIGHDTRTLLSNIESELEGLSLEDTGLSSSSSSSSRLQNLNARATVDSIHVYASRNRGESGYADSHASRSRLLDGADGPSTVCGTDLDLIYRRSLNSRIDNSPVRMGIREAPDGEEGFESQALTSSQTLSNIQVVRTTSNSNLPDSADTSTTCSIAESRPPQSVGGEIGSSSAEVRVPEWISRPRTPLCVVFNDRALIQLNEILGSKINDQKATIENVLREDPRSVYLRQRWGSQFYTFLIHDLHITCRFDDNRGVVTVFQVRHAGRICECGEPEWQCLGHSPPS